MRDSVLIVAPEAAAGVVADALRKQADVDVQIAGTRRAGLAALRESDWSLLLLEESLGCSDPEAADLLYANAGTSLVLETNFAITSGARAVRQVRSALLRRTQEQAKARRAALDELHGDVRNTLGVLLMESQLALREAAPAQKAKLRHIVRLSTELKGRFMP